MQGEKREVKKELLDVGRGCQGTEEKGFWVSSVLLSSGCPILLIFKINFTEYNLYTIQYTHFTCTVWVLTNAYTHVTTIAIKI